MPGAGTHTNIIHEMCLCVFVVWNQFYTHHHDVNVENHIDLKVSHIRIAMKSVSLLTVGQFFPYFVQHTEDKVGGGELRPNYLQITLAIFPIKHQREKVLWIKW